MPCPALPYPLICSAMLCFPCPFQPSTTAATTTVATTIFTCPYNDRTEELYHVLTLCHLMRSRHHLVYQSYLTPTLRTLTCISISTIFNTFTGSLYHHTHLTHTLYLYPYPAALRLAIARNDTSIRNALETFRDDSSESNLSATLRRISRQTIDDTLEEKEADQNRKEVRVT